MKQALDRREVTHSQRGHAAHLVTFYTHERWVLPESVRQIVLDCCLHDNGVKFDLKVAVVMPDHVHMIFTPLGNGDAADTHSLGEVIDDIKGLSEYRINTHLHHERKVWHAESLDHVLQSSENVDDKIEYVAENPMRHGLAKKAG